MASKLIIFIVAALVIIGYVQCSNKKSNNPGTSRGNLDTPQEKDDLKDHLVNANVETQDEVQLNRHKRYLNKKQEEVVVVVKEPGYGEHGGYGEHEGYGEHGGEYGHGGYGHGHGHYGGYRG